MGVRHTAKRFTSRLEIPEKDLLSVIFFLTEQKEYKNINIESKILSCYQNDDNYFYSMEFIYSMNETDTIRTIKNMI